MIIEKHTELLLIAILLNRFEQMAPHHIGALRELLGEKTDEELLQILANKNEH